MKLSYIGLLIIFISVGILVYAGFTGQNSNTIMASCLGGMVFGMIAYIVLNKIAENNNG